MVSKPDYSKPKVEEYGSVESVTEQFDKVGDQSDGVGEPDLDGSVIPD